MSKKSRDYASLCPSRTEGLAWSADENGIVTLDVENKGVFDRIFQLILKKPKVSHIHLDELGSFVWQSFASLWRVSSEKRHTPHSSVLSSFLKYSRNTSS